MSELRHHLELVASIPQDIDPNLNGTEISVYKSLKTLIFRSDCLECQEREHVILGAEKNKLLKE